MTHTVATLISIHVISWMLVVVWVCHLIWGNAYKHSLSVQLAAIASFVGSGTSVVMSGMGLVKFL